MTWLGQNEPDLVQPLGQLLEDSEESGILIGSVDAESPALILVAVKDEEVALSVILQATPKCVVKVVFFYLLEAGKNPRLLAEAI